ncbi:MAG: hypothetical protein WBB64_10190 [Anaerolineales bacterium]
MSSRKLVCKYHQVNISKYYRDPRRFITRIGLLFCLSFFLVSCSSPVAPLPPPESSENGLLITVTTPPYTLAKDSDGFDFIQIEDFSSSGDPGEPFLPRKVISIALPPNVNLESVEIQVADYQLKTLDGTFNIKLSVADIPSDSGEPSSADDGEITEADFIQQLPPGQMRKWIFTKIEYSPFIYDVETGSLSVVSEVQLRIVYDLSSAELDEDLLADDAMDALAEETFINFDSAKDWYLLENQ